MLVAGIIIGLVVLVVLVVLHELGHAIAARRSGVVVEEFGIGFPPKAWAKKLKNGVLFSINWLPLGGFVKLQGENDAASKKGDYGAATFWQKTNILFAGVVVNWATAVVLLAILAFIGIPKILPDQFSMPGDTTVVTSPVTVTQVVDGYPAQEAGVEAGDAIISVNGEPMDTTQELIDTTKDLRGETVSVVYERDGTEYTTEATLRDADDTVFGANLGQQEAIKATWSAPIVGVVTTAQFTWVTFQGLGDILANFVGGLVGQLNPNEEGRQAAAEQLEAAGANVTGPVGLLGVIFPAVSGAGLDQIIFLAAIISLSLAVMNVLPIPALDGGRWFVTMLFKVFKKPLTKEREEKIHGTGFAVLMVLFVVITVSDVFKIF